MSSAPRLARRAGPAGLLTVASLAALVASSGVLAQQRQPQQRPSQPAQQQPAQQTPPAGAQAAQGQAGPTIVQVKPEPAQTEWTKVCGKDQGNNAEVCYTTRDFVSDQGQPVLAVAVYDIKGPQAKKVVRYLMPLGLLVQPGIRFAVDQGTATPGKYAICFPNGCFAEAEVRDDTINAMKKGTTLNVSVQNQVQREVTFAVPLAGFGKAFDGAPIDPKVLEEQQKRLQEELQRRSEELRQRLEQQGQAGAAPGTAPPPAAAARPGTPPAAR